MGGKDGMGGSGRLFWPCRMGEINFGYFWKKIRKWVVFITFKRSGYISFFLSMWVYLHIVSFYFKVIVNNINEKIMWLPIGKPDPELMILGITRTDFSGSGAGSESGFGSWFWGWVTPIQPRPSYCHL